MDRHKLVTRVAHTLYVHRGQTPGRELDDWFLAELLVELCLGLEVERVTERSVSHAEAPSPAPKAEPSTKLAGPRELPGPELEKRALRLLLEAANEDGRASAAAALGYSSTSVVSALLNGRRALDKALAEKIVEAFKDPEESSSTKRAA